MLSPKKSMFCLYLNADKKNKETEEERKRRRLDGRDEGGRGKKGREGGRGLAVEENVQRITVKVISKKERGSFL